MTDVPQTKERSFHVAEIVWFVFGISMLVASILLIRSGELAPLLERMGIWAAVVFVLLKITTLVVAPLGGSPLYLIAGAMFGNIGGFFLVLLGDIIGSSLCFLISRRYSLKVMKFFIGAESLRKVEQAIRLLENTKSFLKARVAFTGGPELLAYASGASKISFWKFFALHIPFYIPINLIWVFLGSQIADVSARYAFAPMILIVGISFVGFLFLFKDYEKLEAS